MKKENSEIVPQFRPWLIPSTSIPCYYSLTIQHYTAWVTESVATKAIKRNNFYKITLSYGSKAENNQFNIILVQNMLEVTEGSPVFNPNQKEE
jgi:hypothetical protein